MQCIEVSSEPFLRAIFSVYEAGIKRYNVIFGVSHRGHGAAVAATKCRVVKILDTSGH